MIESVASFETEDQKAADTLEHHAWTAKQILSNRNFWAITLTMALCMHCIGAVLTHSIELTRNLGFTATQGAWLLSLSAGIGVIGKVLFGWIADHFDTRLAVWLSIFFQFSGVLILSQSDAYREMQMAVCLFGFGMGGVVPLWGSLIGEVFGRENFGQVMGVMMPCMLPIQVSGTPLAGFVFDTYGSYTRVLYFFLGVYCLSAAMMFLLKKQEVDQRIKRKLRSTATS